MLKVLKKQIRGRGRGGFPLEHFHKSCSAAESDLKAAVFLVLGFVSAQLQGFQTCAFAKASPITKNPRSASLHHFSQCSIPENNKSRSNLAVEPGQMGDGSSPGSLSRASIWRTLFSGCWFPDAILHGKRSYRPRSRAVRRLAAMRILSEAFQLASAGGCATGLPTRSRHACEFHSRLDHLVPGQPPLLAVRSPRTTGLASSLSSCLLSHSPAVSFLTSPALGSFSRNLPSSRVLPDAGAPFVRLSAFFFGRF